MTDLVSQVKADIDQIIEDSVEYEETIPSETAAAVCLELAKILSPFIVPSPDLKCAVFPEDDGGWMSLTIQSLKTDHRASFNISRTGDIEVLSINEGFAAATKKVSITQTKEIEDLGSWIVDERYV